MHNTFLDALIARDIPGCIQAHFLDDRAVAREVTRLIDERLPGTARRIDVTKRLILVTWHGAPYDDMLKACSPFTRTGHFMWQGESFAHKPLFPRRRP